MFNNMPQRQPKEKQEREDCEIEVKNTPTGKRIRFKGKCSQSQISLLAKQNGIDNIEESI